ncbi:MAG: SUMF1/EgtB/PvdO family nonheme iron enzyme [Phycisphaerae bacterium]|nr:SUMF1/EgtB/PvdO family nonheme iron enzyme [Phycisphaerae bacterium]
MKKAILIACVVTGLSSVALALDTVPVGNPGNAGIQSRLADYGDATYYGGVAYPYNIGKYEVTAGQYRDFLNAVAATDAYGLYNSNMDSEDYGCQITQNNASGNYTYDFSGRPSGTTEANWANRPVNYVSWYDAAMYANWATSGNMNQGAYDTSAGANWGSSTASDYTGITAHDSAAMDALVSTYGTVYVIPTEDEWYKAAYYNGGTSSYYSYPTSSDTAPSYVNDSGNLSGTGDPFTEGGTDPGNYATYDGDAWINGIGSPYYRTIVGEWEESDSPYGTFDQGGNVWEWTEAIILSNRGARGGSFFNSDGSLHASYRHSPNPTNEVITTGFRVVSVPEPATLSLLALGGVAILRRRRKQ